MLRSDTDRQWEHWGEHDPYFAVATKEENRRANLDSEQLGTFFESGREHVLEVLDTIERHVCAAEGMADRVQFAAPEAQDQWSAERARCIGGRLSVGKALDYGCGVGRVLVWLAEVADEAVGADVADSMLAEAAANCGQRELTNVRLVKVDDRLSAIDETFDLIHSCYVFQHIPPRRGYAIFSRLLDRLASGGLGIFHFNFVNVAPRLLSRLKKTLPFGKRLSNVVRRRPWNDPAMEMHAYSLNKLLAVLHRRGARGTYVSFGSDRDNLSATLYFRVPGEPETPSDRPCAPK